VSPSTCNLLATRVGAKSHVGAAGALTFLESRLSYRTVNNHFAVTTAKRSPLPALYHGRLARCIKYVPPSYGVLVAADASLQHACRRTARHPARFCMRKRRGRTLSPVCGFFFSLLLDPPFPSLSSRTAAPSSSRCSISPERTPACGLPVGGASTPRRAGFFCWKIHFFTASPISAVHQ